MPTTPPQLPAPRGAAPDDRSERGLAWLRSAAASSVPERQRIAFLVYLGVHILVWTLYATASRTNLDIHADMVENFAWSRELGLGYFKHPPLFAWVVAGWFAIFPSHDWAYYLLSFVNVAVAFAGVWALIGLYDASPRRLAAVLALGVTPFLTFSAIKFNANTILLSLWPWLAYAALRAVFTRDLRFATLAGVLAAMALLAKYVSVAMLAATFLAAFTVPGWRQFLRSPALAAMLAAFLAAMAPHLWWLHQAGYPTIAYIDTNKADGVAQLLRSAGQFAVAQVLWLLPAAILLGLAIDRARVWAGADAAGVSGGEDDAGRMTRRTMLVLALAPFAMMELAALVTHTRLSAPWGIPLWFAATFAALTLPRVAAAAIDMRRLYGLALAVPFAVLAIAPLVRFADYHAANATALEPRRQAAEFVSELWRKRTGRPLVNVAGTQSYASSVTFYAPDRPSEFIEFDRRQAPWMSPERLAKGGLAIICDAADKACLDNAVRHAGPRAERVSVTLSTSYLGWRGPPADLVLILVPPRA